MNQKFDTIADINREINKRYKTNFRLRGEIRDFKKEIERKNWALSALQRRGSTNETLKSQHARAIGEELPGKIKSIEEAIKSNKETLKGLRKTKKNMSTPGGTSAAPYGASTPAPVSTPNAATLAVSGVNDAASEVLNRLLRGEGSLEARLETEKLVEAVNGKEIASQRRKDLSQRHKDFCQRNGDFLRLEEILVKEEDNARGHYIGVLGSPEFKKGMEQMNTPLPLPGPVGATPQQGNPVATNLFGSSGPTGVQQQHGTAFPQQGNPGGTNLFGSSTTGVQQQQGTAFPFAQQGNPGGTNLFGSSTTGVQQQQGTAFPFAQQGNPGGTNLFGSSTTGVQQQHGTAFPQQGNPGATNLFGSSGPTGVQQQQGTAFPFAQQGNPGGTNLFGSSTTGAQQQQGTAFAPQQGNPGGTNLFGSGTTGAQQQQGAATGGGGKSPSRMSISPKQKENTAPPGTPPGDKKMPPNVVFATVEERLAALKKKFKATKSNAAYSHAMDVAIADLLSLKEKEPDNSFLKTFKELIHGIVAWCQPLMKSDEGKKMLGSMYERLQIFATYFERNILGKDYDSQMKFAQNTVTQLLQELDAFDLQTLFQQKDEIHCRFLRKMAIGITDHYVK